jgi:peptide/nickel transport system permease protein
MRYIFRRIIIYIIVLIVTLNLDFILPRLTPGNAARLLAGGSKFAPQAAQIMAQRFGLNQPLLVQYELFMKGVFSWPPDFGVSFVYFPDTVTYLFFSRVGWTLLLIGLSFALAVVISYLMSAFASLRRAGKFDVGSIYSSVALNAIPIFWVGLVLLWVFGVVLGWFPMYGNQPFETYTGLTYVFQILKYATLPVVTLTLSQLGQNYLLLRGASQEVLKSDYVTAGKVRGLKSRVIAFSYIMRNSLLPFVSVSSFGFASLVSRIILVEYVFGYAGIGDLIVDAALSDDFPVLAGSLFFVTIIVVIGGIIGDYLLTRLDPRIK